MADVLKIFLIIVGLLLVFNAHWLAVAGLFPQLVERCSAQYSKPLRTTALGLLIGAPLFLIGILVFGKLGHPLFKILGGAFVAVPLILGMVGSTGLSRRIGTGLLLPGHETQPWRRVLGGGTVLSLTFLLPVVGWFVLLPGAFASGL
ncbi:MAG: hypothetical protein ACC661_10735, partial [Verrucomicrobiales bacterium]